MYLFEDEFYFDEFDNDFEFVEEVYYGKSAGLKHAEKLLEKIIEYSHGVYTGKFKGNINNTDEVKEFIKIISKEFNIKSFDITFYTISIYNLIGINKNTKIEDLNVHPNAFTIPSSFQFLKKSKENKKLVDIGDMYIGVNVDIALIVLLDLNPEELMGIILHEIGHCFNASIFTFLSRIPTIEDLKKEIDEFCKSNLSEKLGAVIGKILLYTGKFGFVIQQIDNVMNELISKVPYLSTSLKHIMAVITEYKTILYQYQNVEDLFAGKIIDLNYIIKKSISPKSLFGYQEERFSDSFATAYGYGTGLATAMHKINNGRKMSLDINKTIPILGIGRDLLDVTMKVISFTMDPHPPAPARIINQLNKMKRDLQDPNLNPSVRKELINNINELEDIVNNEVLNIKKYKTSETGVSPVKYFYNYIIIKIFNGKLDPRELMNIGNHYEL